MHDGGVQACRSCKGSALLAAVGHDLRRPLAAATAAVSGLRSSDITLSESDRVELLSTAEESLDALAALVTSLLDVSRLQAGALPITLEPVDAADVILPAVDELGLGPERVDLDLPADMPPMRADHGLLQRVLVNVIANAAQFSPTARSIRVSVSRFAGSVRKKLEA